MKRLLFLMSLVFMVAAVKAQSIYDYDFDLDLYGKGARAAGMAYAFNAVADDATALSWNPAGIIQIKKPEIAFSNSIINTEYRHSIYEYDYKPVYLFDFLGFVYPLKLKKRALVLGASYQNKMNFKFNYENLPSEYSIQHGKKTVTVNSVSFSAAYSINRFIGIGISYNKWFSLGNKSETYSLYYDKKLYPEAPENHPDESIYTRTKTYNYSANNFTVGILFDFSPWHLPLRYTVKYDSKMWLRVDNDYNGSTEYNYYNIADTNWLNSIEAIDKYEFPGILTNGLAYRIGNYLTISCDFDIHLCHDNSWIEDYHQTRSMATGNQEITYFDFNGHLKSPFLYDYIAFNQYRIGIEYILHPEFGFIAIRTGWKSNDEEKQTFDKSGNPVKRTRGTSINVGTGIARKRFSIDLAYEIHWYQRRDEDYEIEKRTDHYFVLSAIWYIK